MSHSIPEANAVFALADKNKAANKDFIKKLKKKTPDKLDEKVHALHDSVFEEMDCLTCANCCRSLGPRITDRDIEKLAKHLRLKPSEFVFKYLKIDEDHDYVFKNMPCTFLQEDNYCSMYAERPKACREYPHTDRKRFSQLLDLTYKNTFTCPAVYVIVDELKRLKW